MGFDSTGWKPIPRPVATNFQFVSTIERDPGLPSARRRPASPHTQVFSQTGWKPIPRAVATNFQFVEPLSVIPVSHRHDGAQRPRTHRFFHRQAGSLSQGPWRQTSSLSAPSSVIPASQWHDEGQRSHTQVFHRQAGSLSHGPWRQTSSLSAPSSVIPASQRHDEGQRPSVEQI